MILRKIIKIVATRCHNLKLNAPNSILVGAPPIPAPFPDGAYSAPPDLLAGFNGTSKGGREGKRRNRRRGEKREGIDSQDGRERLEEREEKKKGGEGKGEGGERKERTT